MAMKFRKPDATGNMPTMDKNNINSRDIQTYIKSQIYFKGYNQGVNAGNNPDIPIVLGGSARRLYGISIFVTQSLIADDDTLSLVINEETIIDKVIWRAFFPSATGNQKLEQFFEIPRPLSGNDSVSLSWTAINAKTIYPIFYLSNMP